MRNMESKILAVADEMIAGVRARGDAYVAEQIARFDGVTLAPEAIKIAPREVTAGAEIAAAIDRDELHCACKRLGIREIYRCGGAAGVAAAALGTESLARVDKIVGPGNAYVTAAKMRLIGEVGIDMTAGPTELVIIADETADAALVQADLDAQAEHGPDSEVILLTTSQALAEQMPARAISFVVDSIA